MSIVLLPVVIIYAIMQWPVWQQQVEQFWDRLQHPRPRPGPSVSSGEQELLTAVQRTFPGATIEHHYQVPWLVNSRGYLLEIDVAVPGRRIAFEFQGEQHYEPIELFGGAEKFSTQRENDRCKRNLLRQQGWKLIEIPYTDRDRISRSYLIQRLNWEARDKA